MPKRTDIHKILIIGAGPIVIGQACEFDYSGTQACKALKEEGYEVVLLNSNPATIMTDPDFADRTYIEPVTPEVLAKIIEKERPDALLPTLGGQTALNTAVAVAENGHPGQVRGRTDRRQAAGHQEGRGPDPVQGGDGEDRSAGAALRLGPQLPGSNGGRQDHRLPGDHPPIVHPRRHRRRHRLQPAKSTSRWLMAGIDASPTNEILVEESVIGWKEYELEVMRDTRRQRGHHLLHRELRSRWGSIPAIRSPSPRPRP